METPLQIPCTDATDSERYGYEVADWYEQARYNTQWSLGLAYVAYADYMKAVCNA